MAAPTYGATGTAAGGSLGITPAYPATVNNLDIAIMVVETANQPVTFPAGWTQIAAPGVGVAAALDAIGIQAAWRRCDGTEDGTTVSIADAGDHQTAQIFTVVGCPTSGDPVDVSASNTNGTASTSYSAPGVTTTVTDCLVVAVIGRSNDSAVTTSFSGEANASLASLTEQFEWGTGTGNGGGGVVITGTKAVAGAVSATTTTGPSATQAAITFALKSTTSSGGGASGPVGMATETDTALALSGVQLRAVGLATATSTALALGAVSIRPVGLATGTATALALAPVQIRPAGLATETDTALALGAKAIRPVGMAISTNTALALTSGMSGPVGLASSANTAFALAAVQKRAVGMATATSTAFALTAVQVGNVGMASDFSEALALSSPPPIALEPWIVDIAPAAVSLVAPSVAPLAGLQSAAIPPTVTLSVATAPAAGAFVKDPPPTAVELEE